MKIMMAFIAAVLLAGAAQAGVITVDDDLNDYPLADYRSIQTAIGNSFNGDTIIIYNGTYYENVVVNKTLNLTGIGGTKIDGMNKGNTLIITSGGSTVKDLIIKNSSGGWNLAGINIASSGNIVSGNSIYSNNGHGVGIYAGDNIIHSNTIYSNGWSGIGVYAGGNEIYSNALATNGWGVRLFQAGNSNIYSNTIENSNTAFYLYNSGNNIIHSNILNSNSADGFYLWNSAGNRIYSNQIIGNKRGFYIWVYSRNNTIYSNNITGNKEGFYSDYPGYPSNNNLLYYNTFINNNNTYDLNNNLWYNSTFNRGNYYSNYNGNDIDLDGIGDSPYNISGGTNRDLYPLMRPYVNNPPILFLTFSPETPGVNEIILFNASLSFDSDGIITSYDWEFGDLSNGTGKTAVHSYSSPGNYIVNLTVTDDSGAKSSISKLMIVLEANEPIVTKETVPVSLPAFSPIGLTVLIGMLSTSALARMRMERKK